MYIINPTSTSQRITGRSHTRLGRFGFASPASMVDVGPLGAQGFKAYRVILRTPNNPTFFRIYVKKP